MDMQVKPRTDAPRILVFATARWQLAARIAINFLERGCIVSVLAPRGHPAECIEGLAAFHRFLPLAPRVTTRRALRVAGADLVVPCDDAAVLALDDLQRHQRQRNSGADRWLPLLERSVGNLEACAFAGSRKDFMTLARDLGLRTPTVIEANSAADILEWMAREQRPVVLKTDHSFGGQGVAVVRDAEEAARTWVRLESRPGLWRTAIRSLLERDSMPLGRWWREQTAPVSAQAMIEGHAANRAVACWRGEVLAGVSVEVLRQQHATGPGTVVRVINSIEMAEAARRLVRHLGVSGFVGFDFMIEAATGRAYLIEMNARATPACHLPDSGAAAMTEALLCRLRGEPLPRTVSRSGPGLIVLFPGEFRSDPSSPYLQATGHDVPWGHPGLVRDGLLPPWSERGWLARLRRQWFRARG